MASGRGASRPDRRPRAGAEAGAPGSPGAGSSLPPLRGGKQQMRVCGAPSARAARTHRCPDRIPSDGTWSRRWSGQGRSWCLSGSGRWGGCTVCPRVAPPLPFIGSRQLCARGRPGEGAQGGPERPGEEEEVTGGGDLPALGAGPAGEAPGEGRASLRALAGAQDLLSRRPLPSAPVGSLVVRRGSKLRGSRASGSDWGSRASTCTPSPSWVAVLTAGDPAPGAFHPPTPL